MPAPPAAAEAVTPRTHLVRGVWWGRTASPLLVAAGLAQVLLQLLAEGDTSLAVSGSFQAAAGLGMVWMWWVRTLQTRLSSEGVAVRGGYGRPRHHPWAEIAHVEPDGPRSPTAVLHLRDGRRVLLPGVHSQTARDLAAVVAARTTPHPTPGSTPAAELDPPGR